MAKILFRCFKQNIMNVSFYGLKENIQYGHEAIARVQKDYPNGFKSNTYYEMFSEEKKPEVLEEYTQGIINSRQQLKRHMRHGLLERDATEIIARETGFANCGEQAFLVSNRLNQMGIKHKVVNMAICSNKTNYVENGHTFCVIDTDFPIDPMEPRSWSEDSVIVDMWSNTVAKSKDAIEYFYKLFKPHPRNQYVRFTRVFE